MEALHQPLVENRCELVTLSGPDEPPTGSFPHDKTSLNEPIQTLLIHSEVREHVGKHSDLEDGEEPESPLGFRGE